MQGADEPLVFAGSASPRLAASICERLGLALGRGEVLRFSEGTLFPRILENVRGRRIYLVQSTVFPANDHFMELLFWVDAFKRASADSVTVVMPYFSYHKGDKKDEPRVSIRARVCADAIEAAGADRVVTMDLHASQIQGFFKIPVDDLSARPLLCEAVLAEGLPDMVVVSPDAGFAKRARMYARRLRAPLAIADKVRVDHAEQAAVVDVIGDVSGRNAVLVDDFTISLGNSGRGCRAGHDSRRAIGHRRREPWRLLKGIDGAPGRKSYLQADHDRYDRDAACEVER